MDLITPAALILLLCSQIQNTGALPVRHDLANYQAAPGQGKQGSFVKETIAAKRRNENPPCEIVPVTDDPSKTTPPPPISVNTPGQKPPPPPPPPPNVLYQPYYVLQYPVRGGAYVYGQGAGQLLPHSPVGASGFLPAPRWFLNLQRDKDLPERPKSNPTGNQRGRLLTQRSDSSSETSSEEDTD